MNLSGLKKPFPPESVSFRIGSRTGDKTKGIGLAYIDARDVMDRLDAVCGPHYWQDRYEFHGSKTVCYLSIRIGDEWITKADGAGDSDVEAEKGAISDALKRAAVKWGIGRYLYDMPNLWVPLEAEGKRFSKEAMDTLRKALVNLSAGKVTETQQQSYSKQRTMINEINACKDKAALVTWYGANERDIDDLPSAEGGMVRDQYEARATAFENGIQVTHTFKFGNVEEQNAWMSLIKGQIEGCDSVTELAEWQEANKSKLLALEPKRKSRVTDLISVTLQKIEAAQKQINQPQV